MHAFRLIELHNIEPDTQKHTIHRWIIIYENMNNYVPHASLRRRCSSFLLLLNYVWLNVIFRCTGAHVQRNIRNLITLLVVSALLFLLLVIMQ